MVNCCDYYEAGAGYEFSVCGNGIGAVIIPSLIGGARDVYWASQPEQTFLSPIFTDLGNLIDNYCDSRMNQTNSTSNSTSNSTTSVPSQNFFSSINIPWTTWGQDVLNSFSDLSLWLSRYS
jgi:hypothetical protein